MTFEMIMAAMYFAAKADRHNHSDDDYVRRIYEQEELEEEAFQNALDEKYPRERIWKRFTLRCTLFVPVYNKRVECLIRHDGVRIYNYTYQNGEKVFDFLGGYGLEYSSVEDGWWIPPERFNDHTGELNKTIEEAMGLVISCGVYRRAGEEQKAINCERKANELLKSRGVKYESKFFCFTRLEDNTGIDIYRVAAEGVELREG